MLLFDFPIGSIFKKDVLLLHLFDVLCLRPRRRKREGVEDGGVASVLSPCVAFLRQLLVWHFSFCPEEPEQGFEMCIFF